MKRLDAGSIALTFLAVAACATGEDPTGDTLDPTFGDDGNNDTTGDGDGDGDTSPGDGDGDGDGDGGDGDGDGDGDAGDGDGDGDGEPPGMCGNGVIEDGEDCDSGELGGQTCMSQGFGGGGLACARDCTLDTSNCNACGDGVKDEGEECDGNDLGDNSTCADLQLGAADEDLSCTDDCLYDFSECSGCGDGVVTDPEQCEPASEFLDKAELDGETCMSLGFDDGLLDCTMGCVFNTDSCYSCGDAEQQGQEQCDGADFGGDSCSDFDAINGQPFNSGSLLCTNECTIDTDNCSLCGDGVITGAEVCDGSALDGETCQSQGLDGGNLGCNNNCGGFDESNCTDCGDGVIEGNEQCDFNNLGGETCQSQGFPGGGTLQCTLGCVFDTGMCANNFCGDGIVNGQDECDCGNQGVNCTAAQLGNQSCLSLGYDGGALACNSPNNCSYNENACYSCGDGQINPGEQCDGNNLGGETCQSQGFQGGGQLSCDQNCGLNTNQCINVPNPYTICINPNLPIPDNASTPSVINIPENGTITDVNISVDMLHTWVGDVAISITHGGVTRTLMDRPLVPAQPPYGCAGDNIDAVFDQGGPGNPETTCNLIPPTLLSPPNFNPIQAIDVYNGMNMNGPWTLTSTDFVAPDPGTLTQWCLTIAWQ
jgi:hypothetical protein